MAEQLAKILLHKVLEDAEAYTDGLSCISCTGELGRDEDGNDTELEHEKGCRWVALQEAVPIIDRVCDAFPKMLEALRAVANYKRGHNVMSEELCPICSHPGRHKRGCPYPRIEKAIAEAEREW